MAQLKRHPLKVYDTPSSYFKSYVETLSEAAETLDPAQMEKCVALIEKTIKTGGTIYSCGNGGSAAIANHLQCDFSKGVSTGTGLVPKVVSVSSEISTITAIANDISYAEVFAFQLKLYLKPGDLVLCISSSGNSPNIVNALKVAKSKSVPSILFCGFDGGDGVKHADISLHFALENYGIIEDLHQMSMHAIAQYLRHRHIPMDDIAKTKF